jgi:hypothetical protein
MALTSRMLSTDYIDVLRSVDCFRCACEGGSFKNAMSVPSLLYPDQDPYALRLSLSLSLRLGH